MITEARIKEVSIPIDNGNAKTGYKVEYNVKKFITSRDLQSYRWYFHSSYLDKDIAEYVKNGIEDQSIPVLYER